MRLHLRACGFHDSQGGSERRVYIQMRGIEQVRVRRRHQRQEVTGLVVNDKVQLSRERRRWLRFHRVLEPAVRAPLLVNVHWAALIEERETEGKFVVDTWFHPNGAPAEIFELDAWKRGASPATRAVKPPAAGES